MENILERMVSGLDEYKALDKSVSTKLETDDDEPEEYTIEPRTMDEVAEAAYQFVEKIWFDRHLSLKYKVEKGIETVDPQIWEGALKSAEKMIQKYGEENLGPYSDFEWGMLNGNYRHLGGY